MSDYDGIFIGAGHNALTAAAYLAKAGLKTLVLERRHVIGGAAVSEEIVPGFTFSVFSYVMSLLHPKVIRELELHLEAGFHPIDVIMHATGSNARIMGLEDKLGRIRSGWLADVILVEGNPLKNLKVLYPTGTLDLIDGQVVRTGGVRWTIKDGFVYDTRELLKDVKDMVAAARTSDKE